MTGWEGNDWSPATLGYLEAWRIEVRGRVDWGRRTAVRRVRVRKDMVVVVRYWAVMKVIVVEQDEMR